MTDIRILDAYILGISGIVVGVVSIWVLIFAWSVLFEVKRTHGWPCDIVRVSYHKTMLRGIRAICLVIAAWGTRLGVDILISRSVGEEAIIWPCLAFSVLHIFYRYIKFVSLYNDKVKTVLT